jgi:hypothetical protein
MMQIINQLLQFLKQAISAIFNFIQTIWQWSVTQILAVPWQRLGTLPWWKVVILAVTAVVVVYLLYRAGRELLDAGEKALAALATLLTVFVRTLPPILLAGAAAAAGAWVINHVNL